MFLLGDISRQFLQTVRSQFATVPQNWWSLSFLIIK